MCQSLLYLIRLYTRTYIDVLFTLWYSLISCLENEPCFTSLNKANQTSQELRLSNKRTMAILTCRLFSGSVQFI